MNNKRVCRTDEEALKNDPCADGCNRGCAHDLAPAKDYTKATHTPGPWSYDGGRDIVAHGGQTPQDNYIGKVYDREDGAGFPNARLIAAAPDLLWAAKKFEGLLAGETMTDTERDMLRAAIAKAEGR